MPHPENIIPPQKGEVRNPKGKEPGTLAAKTILKKYLSVKITRTSPISEVEEELPLAEHLWLVTIAKALNGDDRAMDRILDRFEGKPAQTISADVVNHGSSSINVVVSNEPQQPDDNTPGNLV